MTPHPPARRVLRVGLVWLAISAGASVRAETEADLDPLPTPSANCAALAATPGRAVRRPRPRCCA
ncbi:MAG: hypothetical protein IPG77_24385 [Betaproteobacteria bacterium]|nr:hypothetical protein [Betaproteobacteria bacterium]